MQDFLAKKRGKEVSVKKPIVYISSKRFIDELDDMRWTIKQDYRKIFNRDGSLSGTIESNANKAAKMIFDYRDKFTMYSCRKIYAQLSFQEFAKGSIYGANPTLQLWVSRVLGHSDTDMTTANHYQNYRVEKNTFTSTETASKIETLENKVEVIEKQVEDLPRVAPVLKVNVKNQKVLNDFAIVKEIYDAQEKKPNQTQLEVLCRGKVPREFVRLWYKKNVRGE